MSARRHRRTVVITGVGSRLGSAVRERCLARGWRVVGVDATIDSRAAGDVVADLATSSSRSSAINEVLERTGASIDSLIVIADGGGDPSPASLVARTYFASVSMLDGLRPVLAAGTDPAAVVLLSNTIGITPIPDPTLLDTMVQGGEAPALALVRGDAAIDLTEVHAMCHTALAWAVRSRVMDWGRARVRLNGVAVGPLPMATDRHPGASWGDHRTDGSGNGWGDGQGDGPGDAATGPVLDALPVPLDRRAEPDEVASVVEFLIGPDASAVHGSIIYADAGTDALVRPDAV